MQRYQLLRFCLACLFGILCMAAAHAEASYRLGPEDVVTITVLRHPEFSGEYLIPPDGTINVPGAGTLVLLGKTIDEATQQLTLLFKPRLQQPEVNITLKSMHTQHVYVLGEVKMPGLYEIQDGMGVVQAISRAGGLSLPVEEVAIDLLRSGKDISHVDPRAALTEGNATANLPLVSGDVVRVWSLHGVDVVVAGEVQHPGSYQLNGGGGMVEALALAGGASPRGSLRRVMLIHEAGDRETVDIVPAVYGGHLEDNHALVRGDMVLVPENSATVSVLGDVTQPGSYPLPEDRPLLLSDALGLAKGAASANTRLNQVAILRTEGGKQQRMIVDLQKYFTKGDASANPTLAAGDVIYFTKASHPNWNEIFEGVVSTALLARTLY